MSDFAATRQRPVHAAELASIEAFKDVAHVTLDWLASLMWAEVLEPGQVLVVENSRADRMFIVLEGELHARVESEADPATYVVEQGEITGMLPFSRMREFPVTVRAAERCRVACLQKSHFDAILDRIPELAGRLVGVMSDRIREVTRDELQRDKLVALGRLSAGLAHGLNNPAAAILRVSESIRQAITDWQESTARLERLGLTPEQRSALEECERECVADVQNLPILDSLAQSDREEELARVLEDHGVRDPWRISHTLAECGFVPADLNCVANVFPPAALADVLTRLESTLTIERLLGEISTSTRRMSELVRTLKDYSYMDQGSIQQVDVHRGIDNTLTILQHRIASGTSVLRQYDASVPRLRANGAELNQVWTVLLDNALDAVGSAGEIRIRTKLERDRILVEVSDNGPGIPASIQQHVFDPFFTTKPEGQGTGIGLDLAYHIVRKHHGDIRFESRPGATRFQVRLPLDGASEKRSDRELRTA